MADRIAEAQAKLDARRARTPRVHFEAPRQPRGMGTLEEAITGALAASEWVSDEEVERYEAGRERDRRLERLRDSGVADVLMPEMVSALVTDRLGMSEALTMVRRWAAWQRSEGSPAPRPVLALIGRMGRGKTVAAAWLVVHEGARYVTAEELSRLAASRWGEELQAWRRIVASRMLVVDEVGTEDDKRRAAAAYRELIDRRQGRRPTLLCGNVSKLELIGGYDERTRRSITGLLDPRTVDRLRALAVVRVLDGESLRRGTL